jgi:hypothetical protein
MRLLVTAICFLILQAANAQFTLVPLPAPTNAQPDYQSQKKAQARTKAVLALPFWDDFSQVTTLPSPELWIGGSSTWVNNGLGIHPPSLNVATFDGVDSLGRPYSVNDVLAKGFADKLESNPIDLSQVAAADVDSIFFSFYYQLKGRGELPDAGDRLLLEFRNAEGNWEEVWTIENDGVITTDVFTPVVLPVNVTFLHAGFQFRFKNFARLSGPYDTWHLDYVYLNKDKNAVNVSYPDRSVVSPLTSIFNTYRAIPKTHFFVDMQARLTRPTFIAHNLKLGNQQPVNYFSYLQVDRYEDGAITAGPRVLLDSAVSIDGLLLPQEFRTVEADLEGISNHLDETADSLLVNVKVALSSGDNKLPANDGDYDLKYAPIDFRLNDTTRAAYWLSSFYAYDDGAAEYGAALNQPGAQVAYQFNLVGETSGFINSVQLYFPKFGDETQQVIELMIWNDLNDVESSILYNEVINLQRTENNVLWQKKLNRSVPVSGRFYVGWKQSSAAVIAIGFDKNTNSGDKIFYNVSGTWEENQQLAGSLMIRPVFGENRSDPDPDPGPVGLEEEAVAGLAPYPNPSSGTFVVPGAISNLTVTDISGRAVSTTITETPTESTVSISDARSGVYVVQYIRDGWPRRCKIMVR